MSNRACCICSTLLDTFDAKTEKPIVAARELSCCSRTVCQRCIASNPRYRVYCPYCQISTEPSALPQGLRDPPPYADVEGEGQASDLPPAYNAAPSSIPPLSEKSEAPAPDVLHFLTPDDSLQSLSLAYGVPIDALRKANNVFSDHLVQGRRTVLIPGQYYKGQVSLSPRPVEGEEEEARKSKLRRFMVSCKVAEYDLAVMYLEQADYNLEAAIEAYKDDEAWEKEHPRDLQANGKKKQPAKAAGMRRFVGGS